MKYYCSIFVCLLLVSCNQKETDEDKKSRSEKSIAVSSKECISKLLEMDDSLGTVRNYACETISLSETIENYAEAMANLPTTSCPEKFVSAYQKHQEAWVAMKSVADQYPDLRGEMHDLFDQIAATKDSVTFKPLLKDIWDTWAEVEKAKTH